MRARTERHARSPAESLRATMAAVRVSFTWLGVRKTLTSDQKAQAAEPFGAAEAFLSAAKKLLDTREPHLEAVLAVLTSKMIKRGIDARALDRQKAEAATHKTLRQVIKLKNGIDRETAKVLQKQIQGLGLKVRAQIQGEALRVVSAKLDDLQAVQAAIRAKPPEIPVQFNNYK